MSARFLRLLGSLLLPALFLVLSGASAWATVQTGSLVGVITGKDGTPIPGAQVSISGPSMIGGTRTEKTDERGQYHIVEIPPGSYSVSVEAMGFQTQQFKDVAINLDNKTTLDVSMAPPVEAAGQSITITETKPTIDTTQTQEGEVVDQSFLLKLPVGDDYLSVAGMLPGVFDDGSGNPNVGGASQSENMFLVDGVNITDPVTGTFSANFNFESIQQVEVLTGGFDPEHQALGGVVNVVTKSGGNDFHGGVSGHYHDDLWSPGRLGLDCGAYPAGYVPTGNDAVDEVNCADVLQFSERTERLVDYTTNLWLGGPIIRDKLWFFTSYEFIQDILNTFPTVGAEVVTGHLLQGKLTYQPLPRHKFTLGFQADPSTFNRVLQSPYVPNIAEAQQQQGGVLLSLEHTWFPSDKLVVRNQLNFKNQYIDFLPNSGDLSTPGTIGILGALSEGNYSYYQFNRRDRIDYSPKVTYYRDNLLGSHEAAVGLDVSYVTETFLDGYPGNLYYVNQPSIVGNPQSAQQNLVWVETSGPVLLKTNALESGLYLQDAWKPAGFQDRLVLRGGIRFDRDGLYNDSGQEVVDFFSFSPRIYAAYDVFGDGKTVVRGGYGRFIDPGKLSQSDFLNKHSHAFKEYLGPGAGLNAGNAPGALIFATEGESTTLRAGAVTPPAMDAITLGFERDLVKSIAVGLTWNARWTYNLFEADDSNFIWNGSGTEPIGNRVGVIDNRFRLRTPGFARRYYQDLEFTVRRRFADQFELLGSYTYSVSEGTTPDAFSGNFAIPSQQQYAFGYLPNDHTNAFKLAASYDFNFGLTSGVNFHYISGDRFEHFYWNDYSSGYFNRNASQLSYGQLPGAPVVDLRLRWNPKVALKDVPLFSSLMRYPGKLDIDAQVFNLLDNRQVLGYQQFAFDDRDAERTGAREAPMSFLMGARYEF